MKPAVSIIIVTHEHAKFVTPCLTSVLSQRNISYEVIVVDNRSGDETTDIIKKKFPTVILLPQRIRRGFAANVNTGIMASRGRYLIVLNPDTQMKRNAISQLVDRLQKRKPAGICGPQLVNPDGSIQLSFRNFPTWKTGIVRRTPLRYVLGNSGINKSHLNAGKNHAVTCRVDWLLGACLALKKEMVDDIGLLDERYPLYVEDIDYCLRAQLKGWEVWYEPKSVVIHQHMARSDRGLFNIYSYYHAVSMRLFILKFWHTGLLRSGVISKKMRQARL